MKTRAAILWQQPGKWETTDVELDPPGDGEVLLEMVATGLCHSDDHFAVGGATTVLPFCGGHEGAGIVRQVGPNVAGLAEGDHIVTAFISACGRCRWCSVGRGNLCDNGAAIAAGTQLDGTYRMWADGKAVATMSTLGTFAEWQVVDQLNCIKVDDALPLDIACVLGCAVPTGWGSATNAAAVRTGDVVVVIGCGGIGINAVQGAAMAGASRVVAVDPVEFKREMSARLGATEGFADAAQATEFVRSITNGQGADSAIVAVGVTSPEYVRAAFDLVRKGGTVVVTGLGTGSLRSDPVPVSLAELTLFEKRIQGSLYGGSSPREQIPMLLRMYESGRLKLAELVTRTYGLDQINDAYADLHAGRILRGVVKF